MSLLKSDLVVVCVCAVAGEILILLAPDIITLRVVLGLLLVLVLPGYALTAALLPGLTLEVPQRILLSIGLSLIVAILSGLILNGLEWRLQTSSWTAILVGVTISACAAAWIRRRGYLAGPLRFHFNLHARDALLLGVAGVITLVAVGLALTPMPARDIEGYTMLWIQPEGKGTQNEVRLGITSHELTSKRYRLQVKVGDQIVQDWPAISLMPGKEWSTTILIPVNSSSNGAVEAALYLLDKPDIVYRRVVLRRGS